MFWRHDYSNFRSCMEIVDRKQSMIRLAPSVVAALLLKRCLETNRVSDPAAQIVADGPQVTSAFLDTRQKGQRRRLDSIQQMHFYMSQDACPPTASSN
jgi:hypothetical protein